LIYRIEITPTAQKQLAAIPLKDRQRIDTRIVGLASNPIPQKAKKLEGESRLYRLRSGNYRVIYKIQKKALVILIVKVGHRKDIYRKF
jgi:mRNA interferase RelE/StbE